MLNHLEKFYTADTCIVVYHKNCTDGLMAAAVMADALEERFKEVQFFECGYDAKDYDKLKELLLNLSNYSIVVVDFSLPKPCLDYIYGDFHFKAGYILDHHKTAFEMYFPNLPFKSDSAYAETMYDFEVHLDNRKSGAGIAASHFLTDAKYVRSSLVAYIQDWDLWKFEFGDYTRYFNAYITAYSDRTVSGFRRLLAAEEHDPKSVHSFVNTGKTLYEQEQEIVEKIAAGAEDIQLGDLLIPTVFCEKQYCSKVGNILASLADNESKIGACIVAKDGAAEVSLRSIGDVDVSAIAKQYGGGGHKNAAGFMITSIEREKVEFYIDAMHFLTIMEDIKKIEESMETDNG